MASFPVTNGVTTFIPPPPGVVPNFDHPQQQKWLEHYLVFAIGGPLAFLALCQRYYTKIYLSKGLQIDDFFMFLGWSMSIVTQALLVRSIAEGGMCAHAWEMPLDRFERYSVITYIAAPVYQLCNGFTKLSLLAIYLQLSPQKWFKIATWSSIVIVTIYTIVISGIMFFHCNPVRKAFDFQIAHGSCLDAGTLYMATAVSNIITDVILFLLPTPLVLRLEMDRAQKIGAIVIFGIGSMTVATSIIRLTELPATLKSTDPSWDAAPADVWTFVEGNLFVICGSMPTIRRFARHMLPSVFAPPTAPSTAGSGNVNNTISQNSSRPKRCRQYELFTEDNEMHEFEARDVEEASHKDNVSNSETTVAWGGDTDTNSEKAILESRDLATKHYD